MVISVAGSTVRSSITVPSTGSPAPARTWLAHLQAAGVAPGEIHSSPEFSDHPQSDPTPGWTKADEEGSTSRRNGRGCASRNHGIPVTPHRKNPGHVHDAEVIPRQGIIAVQLQGPIQMLQRTFLIVRRREQKSQVDMSVRVVGIHL